MTSNLNSQSLYYKLNISWIKSIIIISIILRITFMKIGNPILIMILIIAQTLILCLILWTKLSLSWFSYILFLIFIGGLMVLFIYICRLASNEIFFIKINIVEITLSIALLSIIILSFKRSIYDININYFIFIIKMITNMNKWVICLTIIYLLFTLIVVVKISNKKIGPIRSYKI